MKRACSINWERRGEERRAFRVLVREPGGKRPVGRPRGRREGFV
jgi:hypothetical protein